ncbi:serine hydrolase domain-containing protein [Lewinella sp. IMCC34191]|uniref:serine hydrolase domain-containing protein n=1 Tax=Lewinella sp. IMCC34191 TaxID=2259172 RepID=UPI000E2325E3|nr:serine hydrolase domain-containing protein [Lewinella sp. IMCC34191]
MYKVTLLLLLAATALACSPQHRDPASAPGPGSARDSLTTELDSIRRSGEINGFGVAMVDDRGVLYSQGFGVADRETGEAYTEHTLQHIASVSKTLIGIALMKVAEMGKLELDDPIGKYLPFRVVNPNFPDEAITVRHLATHTSGINDTEQYMKRAWIITEGQDLTGIRTDYPAQQLNLPEKDIPMADYLKDYLEPEGEYYQSDNYTGFAPGERYNYSNIGATLCALIIERVSGQPFDRFTKEHILAPLGMSATGWSLEAVDVKRHSRLYRNDHSVLPFYTAITYPDGMLISSSSDMAKYLAELIKGYTGEGKLLSRNSYAELFRPQLSEVNFASRDAGNPYNEDYDPAIFIGHSGQGYVGHSGGDAGVGTWMFFDKETENGRYIVINTDFGGDERAKELEYYAIWDLMNEYFDRLRAQRRADQ